MTNSCVRPALNGFSFGWLTDGRIFLRHNIKFFIEFFLETLQTNNNILTTTTTTTTTTTRQTVVSAKFASYLSSKNIRS